MASEEALEDEVVTADVLGLELLQCARYGEEENLLEILNYAEKNLTGDVVRVDIDFQDPITGNSALHLAAANGQLQCLVLLCRRGAKILQNHEGSTAIHW
jgi:ankyrin repeat protein